jgi:hypothetical protein
MAFVITQSVRAKARRELKELKFEYRTLIKEEGNEECVICGKDTSYMLQPENTVLKPHLLSLNLEGRSLML